MITIGWMKYKNTQKWQADIVVNHPNGRHARKRAVCPYPWVAHTDGDRFEDKNRPKKADKWAEQKGNALFKKLDKGETQQRAPLLADWWPEYIAWCRAVPKHAKGHIDAKESHWRTWLQSLAKLRLDQIDDSVIAQLCAQIQTQIRFNVLQTLSACLHHAVTLKKIAAMPCRFGKATGVHLKANRPKQRNEFYRDYDRMLAVAASVHPNALVAVLLGGDGSMRVGEIIGLEWSTVYAEKIDIIQQIYRGEKKLPKKGKTRFVWMSNDLRAALRKHPRRTFTGEPFPGSYVISHEDGSPYAYREMRALLAKVEIAAGLQPSGKPRERTPQARTHLLRHTFCTHLAQEGAAITEIRDLAGHSSVLITQGYMHHAPGALEGAIRRLSDRERGKNTATASTETL